MDKRNNYSLRKKIKYILDDFISKGFWAQILLLTSTVIIFSMLFGLIAMKFGEEDYVEGYWTSLMHMIDQGTITSDEKGTDAYFMFLLIVTFIGMAITSTIIAIISSAFQEKLNELKKGHSEIIEHNHVLVLGFDENAYTICHEIIECRKIDGERICLVVIDNLPKEEMEHTFKEYHSNSDDNSKSKKHNSNVKRLFRSGDPSSENSLMICAAENAGTIVINRENDLDTVRILLSLVSYLKKNNAYLDSENMPNIVAVIHNHDNISAAIAAAELNLLEENPEKIKKQSKIQIVHDEKMLENLFANTCVQQGLPFVMDEMFNCQGVSISIEDGTKKQFFEDRNVFIGKTISEISDIVINAIPLGFIGNNTDNSVTVKLNPLKEITYQQGDCLVYLSEERNLSLGKKESIAPVGVPIDKHGKNKKDLRNLLCIGWSSILPGMLRNVGEYCTEGSSINVITATTDSFEKTESGSLKYNTIKCVNPYSWGEVKRILDENPDWFDQDNCEKLTNILLFSREGIDKNVADENVMLILLNIRQYIKDKNCTNISITSEMRLLQNQLLLQRNSSNDLVVATEITNRMIAQITDDPRKKYIIEDLLQHNNAMIELHPLSDYIDVSHQFNFACAFESVKTQSEQYHEAMIPLGWIRLTSDVQSLDNKNDFMQEMVMNPTDDELKKCYCGGNYAEYRLILLADGFAD